YVPLDPAYPADRLAYMLADCAPVALLTQGRLADQAWLQASGVPQLLLDDEAALATQPLHDPQVAGLGPQHLAYVIYTSGSTGQPKGVAIEHAQTLNLIGWALANFTAEELAETVFSTSMNFDLAVFELFVPLSCGATVNLVADALALTAQSTATLLNTVPSALSALLDAGQVPRSVRTVNLAGEPLKRGLVERIFAQTGVTAVANLYGPSETTTYSTGVRMPRAGGFVAHIGRPIANTQVYILDAQRQPVPVGVTGELYIGGAGVARGYLNRAELTAERFIADPFSEVANARLYKTGDLGRWLADGNIEYLGRNDFQVKIRGFRIELGEIEAQLSACAGVREAVVLAREDIAGDPRLVAYAIAQDGIALSAPALREALARELAAYMLPAAFVFLREWPLTPNGKLDRKALPAADLSSPSTRDYADPQGATEQAIAAIWQRLLGVERVGRYDHFFERGGHSLLATRVVGEIGKALGKPLALRALFEYPQLDSLAARVDAQAASGHAAIGRADRAAALPLSFAQQRLWFIDQLEGSSAQYNMPLALRLQGRLDTAALQQALDGLLQRHEVLRTVYAEIDGMAVQRVVPAASLNIACDDLRGLDAASREVRLQQRAEQEAVRAFDLSKDTMLRCALVKLADDDQAVLFTLHHIVADAWSLEVLVREFVALYRAAAGGVAAHLPALAIQYADYAHWQRERLQGPLRQSQLQYWREQLAGLPVVHNLPLDKPRPAQQRFEGARVEQVLEAPALAALNALARRHDASLFMLLQAAFAVLISRWSGESDIVIGTPIAGRLHP
ncbi:non-ribosomal peptide synthetase, partial [Tahibacter aquaticus]|uniref:non-ribosomal peptide synthetase n=1 Tax=Tahibacter aquaticus TaxID=520092 RepID=UPI00105B85C3